MRRLSWMVAWALLASGLAAPSAQADVLLEYVGPRFTKYVMRNDMRAPYRPIEAGMEPPVLRARVRVVDELAASGDFSDQDSFQDGREAVRSIEISDGSLVLDRRNPKHRLEFRVTQRKGQLASWQMRGTSLQDRLEISILGPERTNTGAGASIPGADDCPGLDIVVGVGWKVWHCGLGQWTISRIPNNAVLPPMKRN